jgi:ABC-type glycerol-3-phosphate transport system substrate-binding protein
MSKKTFLILLFALFAAACGGNSGAGNSANAVNSNGAASGSNTNVAPSATPNANTNQTNSAPKRIAFNKGANWGAVNMTLAAGAAQKFVVGAKSGQTMDVEASSKDVSINLVKGKAETTEDFGFLTAELRANGDYVFEVRNSTKKEIKTSVKVTIEGGKTSNETDETDATINEDAEVNEPSATDKNQ